MQLHGRTYGLYVIQHPGSDGPTEVIYHLDDKATRLTATIGIDQSMNPDDPIDDQPDVEYLVYIDGGLAWQSGVVTHKSPPIGVDVDLSGAATLRLVVTDGGDDPWHDWAIWADPEIHLR